MARGSAAFMIAIVAIMMGLVGSLMLTVTDPVQQALFASSLWESSTQQGTNALSWQKSAWIFFPAFILLAIMLEVWIVTRRPM